MALTPNEVVSGLVRRGIPQNAAMGFAGNFMVESRLDPGINEIAPLVEGSRGGFGLAQWTGPRRRQLEAFAGSQGRSVDDPELQMDFLAWELQNTESKAAQKIFQASDPEEAARLVSTEFLRPGIPHLDRRIQATRDIAGGGGVQVASSDGISAAQLLQLFGETEAAPEEADNAPVDALNEQVARQEQSAADLLKLFDTQAAPLQGSAPELERIAQPPSIAVNEMQIPESTTRGELDITRRALEPSAELLGAVGQSLTGQGPSVAGGMLPEGTPGAVGRVLDVGLGVAGGLGAVGAAAAGLTGDIAEGLGMGSGSANRLARDLQAMPEAFAGSPGIVSPAQTSRFGRVPDDAVAPQARRVAPRIAREVPEAAADTARLAAPEENKMRALIARAANNNRAARQELAEMARVNPDALEAAQRLGIDVPVDVFADNAAVRQAAGIVRAVRGSDAGAEWEDTFNAAQTRAAEIMRQEGAGLDLSTQSEVVRRQLTDSIDTLRREAGPLYDAVKESVPTGSRVSPSETTKVFNDIVTGLGGQGALTGPERRLFNALTSQEGMTYERLIREKDQIARAAFKNQGPYADADTRTMTRLYEALSQDQQNFIESVGGSAEKLRRANDLWSEAKSLEDDLVRGFGRDGQGSIASKITAAITQGAKGDIKSLNTVLSVIPDNLQREALLTGIDSLSQARSGQGGFSFPQYAKIYRGLRQNNEVYSRISKTLGPETEGMLRDLYEVSVRMDRAQQNVPRTGLANQGLIGESLMARILDSSAGRSARTGVGAMAGGAMGGPIGSGVGAAAAGSINIGGRRAKAAGLLFKSPEFQRLAIEAARKGQPSAANVRDVVKSPAYRKWARTVGIDNPEQWLLGALAGQQATQEMEQQQ